MIGLLHLPYICTYVVLEWFHLHSFDFFTSQLPVNFYEKVNV